MNYSNMTAPCGLDCFNCPLYLAVSNEKLRNIIAEKMKMDPGKVICRGCRNENGTIAFNNMTGPCKVYRCISAKGLHLCSDCADFPCDNLHPYADQASVKPHNTKVFNLCLIKKMGLEEWAKNKAGKVKETYMKAKLEL